MTDLLKDKEIAIIGGGPAGLTLARLLQMQGAAVAVYERDLHKNARPKGATLDLHEESGLLALEAAGLMDAFRANYRPGADKVRVVDKHGNILMEDSEADASGRNRPEIDRGPLQDILLNSLLPGTVVWGRQFSSMEQQNGAWKISFKYTEPVFADIVIAADGANSRVRPYLTPIKPRWAGVTAIEGAVYDSAKNCPGMHRLLNGGKIFAMGDEKVLIVSSKGDGRLVFYTSVKTEEDWVSTCGIDLTDKQQVLSWFKAEYSEWDSIWHELFENATGAFIPRPQYCIPTDQQWEAQPNLTMVGDAAHLMPPFAGEGVNMAMLDALELSRQLTSSKHTTLHDAIAVFEEQMRQRAAEAAEASLMSTAVLHSDGAIPFLSQIIS
ncbi:MAG TPA: NAD(P)/FAD-dependent oxidoreductase [Mucilaginibacter sp.]|nr:NAD(P)/FAD-dependent oxidoreductase [Mucilaginibacter sp.]